jgi:hypothetical protein
MPAELWSWARGNGVEGRRLNLVCFVRAGAASSVGIIMVRAKKHWRITGDLPLCHVGVVGMVGEPSCLGWS